MKKVKINKGFITQKMGEKMTIFDAEESVLYTFNETASYIFSKIKLGWEKQRIIDRMVEKYKIKEKKAQEDLKNLLKDLRRKKIISQKAE